MFRNAENFKDVLNSFMSSQSPANKNNHTPLHNLRVTVMLSSVSAMVRGRYTTGAGKQIELRLPSIEVRLQANAARAMKPLCPDHPVHELHSVV